MAAAHVKWMSCSTWSMQPCSRCSTSMAEAIRSAWEAAARRWGGEAVGRAVGRAVREAASASAPHDPAQLPPRPARRGGSPPPCARLPAKALTLVASMPSSAPSCSKEMFVYSLEAASMLCSITARSSTCAARGCRLGLQAGVAGWGCRLGARGAVRGSLAGHTVEPSLSVATWWGAREAAKAATSSWRRGAGTPRLSRCAVRASRPAPPTRYAYDALHLRRATATALPALPSLRCPPYSRAGGGHGRRAVRSRRTMTPYPVPPTPYPVPRTPHPSPCAAAAP